MPLLRAAASGLALPWLYCAAHCLSLSLQRMHDFSFADQHHALPCRPAPRLSTAAHGLTVQCHSSDVPLSANAMHCYALPCRSNALLYRASPMRSSSMPHFAFASHGAGTPRQCLARHCCTACAQPSLCHERKCYARAMLGCALLCQCTAELFLAFALPGSALTGSALPGYADACQN